MWEECISSPSFFYTKKRNLKGQRMKKDREEAGTDMFKVQSKNTGASVDVWLLSLEEFKNLEGEYPGKRNLYRSMSQVTCCKIECSNACILGTMKLPREKSGVLHVQRFGFYLNEKELLLIEEGTLLKPILGKISNNSLAVESTMKFLLLLFETLIEDDVIYFEQQEEKLSDMEEGLLKRLPEHFHETIITYRKQFQAYHSYYEQLIHLGEQLLAESEWVRTKEEADAWQFYVKHAQRLREQVELLRDYLVQLRELYQSLMDVQQNKVMSILTVVTTIFLPLTLIAGWYGMNFPGMPEFHWRYAYPAVILVSVLITVLEILFFRKKKML